MSTTSFDAVAETQRLISLLEPLIGCFERLAILLEQERQALKKRHLPSLETSARQIEDVLNEIKHLDTSRQTLSMRMGKALGLSKEAMNLKELDEAMGGGTGLLEYRQRLRERIDQADRSNQENQAIFKGVLVATEAILRTLKESTQGPAASYNRRGFRQSGPGYHFLSKQF
ncbi:MAG: flagellar protein FlgN [Magnetococcales bacterium]|nr:flagellar protein FlgN [Magnetococcales bacterium]MBF0438492.1 flagellar protein FlgN [Magnetococcales bacterium]